ncbi:hypothetical protein [Pseudoalteromonas luteoviolacea]|uniref:Lipoprotein n=1 Tax=Pseudoalteromonas luteoviolacea S4054 TaxID=1129367 RepID=A0A0F6AHI1_9GAMM|nr:hypothetical protein [Pseudoalteromonas luteoviolacea]AOT08718.1 hypothetical protein S4054249_13025 [Pseudoalteromonas luteoviolacea]AOT13633.1 hypothetical protein S40542_13000 [Pseudoalteromonas luteoviolacea]AOT18546.1 hypothetical protein S4054_13000 [Pseudoalteromonas luteoviolacea]KKE85613.1 hypothetical protein N479_25700 [Pseudoalteromonas luteoviolacea S4054]KZN71977.1 hypothetical protein N481_16330 [Pseudoalteromonas luteoviolacea S4047-1]
MKILIIILLLSFLTACGFHPIKLVGYGKKLDEPVSESCFFEKFEEYRASTNYQLSVEVEKAAEEIIYYKLTIDGTKTNDAHEVFTPKSFNESKVFMGNIMRECSA